MRTKITLACTECKQRNYNMTKDKKTHPDRMETKKYCKFCKSHTMHKETKKSVCKGCEIMGDTVNNEGAQKRSFFKGLKAEFHKIVWPDKDTVTKQTIAVVSASIALGLVIAIIDLIIKFGLSFIL